MATTYDVPPNRLGQFIGFRVKVGNGWETITGVGAVDHHNGRAVVHTDSHPRGRTLGDIDYRVMPA
jgi:hypothetical protein